MKCATCTRETNPADAYATHRVDIPQAEARACCCSLPCWLRWLEKQRANTDWPDRGYA